MEIKILADRYGYLETVEELKEQWLYDLLLHVGLEPEVLEEWDNPSIVELFLNNNIEIVNYPSIGGVMVSYRDDVIGEWGGPDLTLMRDHETGELYYEITIEYWSILDEDEE